MTLSFLISEKKWLIPYLNATIRVCLHLLDFSWVKYAFYLWYDQVLLFQCLMTNLIHHFTHLQFTARYVNVRLSEFDSQRREVGCLQSISFTSNSIWKRVLCRHLPPKRKKKWLLIKEHNSLRLDRKTLIITPPRTTQAKYRIKAKEYVTFSLFLSLSGIFKYRLTNFSFFFSQLQAFSVHLSNYYNVNDRDRRYIWKRN